MFQGVPGITSSSGDGGVSAQAHESGGGGGGELGGGGGGGFSEEGERNSGGNRWPRQETLALIKIRSDMDVAFRDSNLKAPLWDEVSRKLAELGYHRSAKKCKEKFENVYKYHKRTKEGRTSKADGKTYRFFDQLQALEATTGATQPPPPPPLSLPAPPPPPPQLSAAARPITMPTSTAQVASSPTPPFSITASHQNNVDPISVAAPAVTMPTVVSNVNHVGGFPFSNLNLSGSTNSMTSSSTSSDDAPPEMGRKGKRKWKDFFGRLMKEVIHKQEELQSKFLETLERRELERMAREEAWRQQEMAKMKRERELLAQERSTAAAKDTAVVTFLQKISEHNPQMPPISTLAAPPPSPPQPQPAPPPATKIQDNSGGGGGENMLSPSPSRWPKAEINALIKLRTTLDTKYQENAPKGPLWEEISAAMRSLGYNRNAKRCKEKWENINKYYKKVKESSKKRPEDSKTCPYFHQLDAIYRERAIATSNNNPGFSTKPETQIAPIMARPEQQWPLPAPPPPPPQPIQIHAHYDDDVDDEGDEEEEDEGGEYEIVPNKTSSMAAVE